MLKCFISLFAVLILLSSQVFADTLTVDLDTATSAELQSALELISTRLNELNALSMPVSNDKFVYTGSGTHVLQGVNTSFSPIRMVAQSTSDIKITLCAGDKTKTYDGGNSSRYQFSHWINEQFISSIIVETQGEWCLEFSPILSTMETHITGNGSIITECFAVTPPQLVTISFDDGLYGGYTYIDLYKIHDNGFITSEEWLWQDIVQNESFDYIIKPENNILAYFIGIRCPHDTNWDISIQ